jgi:hypothetical protein
MAAAAKSMRKYTEKILSKQCWTAENYQSFTLAETRVSHRHASRTLACRPTLFVLLQGGPVQNQADAQADD